MTFALATSPPEKSFLSSLLTAMTLSNVTLPPTLPSSRSTSTVSPGATRYCFPPLRITAYMLPPEAVVKPQLYGCCAFASTKTRGTTALRIFTRRFTGEKEEPNCEERVDNQDGRENRAGH